MSLTSIWRPDHRYLPLPGSPNAADGNARAINRRSCLKGFLLTLLALSGLLVLSCLSPLSIFDRPARNSGWRDFALDVSIGIPAVKPTLAQQLLDEACADAWIARGELCENLHGKLGTQTRRHIDVIIPWVNGSAEWLIEAKATALGGQMEHENRFRDHKELIHNIRAIVENVSASILRRIYLLTADLPLPANWTSASSEAVRIGQVPTWLDLSEEGVAFDDAPEMHVLHHSHFMRLRKEASKEEQDEYRQAAIPTFNSNAFEVSLGMIPDLAENVLYLNDDMLIVRRLTASDLATPLYGPQFRSHANYRMNAKSIGDAQSEYPGMGHASWLLDARFGERKRPYLSHGGRVMSTSSLRETTRIWKEEFDEAGLNRFRNTSDINGMFIHAHFHVEKHREALLWSMLVARFDANHDGKYSLEEKEALLNFVRQQSMAPNSGQDEHLIKKPRRDASQADKVAFTLGQAGLRPPQIKPYEMTSFDGYAYLHKDAWPSYPPSDGETRAECSMILSQCFDIAENAASQDVFRNLAFEQPICGDCLIVAGLTASGWRGLEAFLPPVEHNAPSHDNALAVPPLLAPDAKNWRDADFSLAANAASWSLGLRSYCVRLIQRYQYAMSEGAETLLMIAGHYGLAKKLDQMAKERSKYNSVGFVVLNDDVKMESELSFVNDILIDWMEKLWSKPSRWELETRH